MDTWNNIQTDKRSEKQRLRTQKRRERASLSDGQRERNSREICERLLQYGTLAQAERIYCYAPLAQEADIRPLCEQLWEQGKRLAFPRVDETAAEPAMSFYEAGGWSELAEGAFHVYEPSAAHPPVDWQGAPVLVPGVVFAPDGARLGYGKGYYDRYFSKHPAHVRIGVAFSCQLCEQLSAYCEPTDQRMDVLVTEKDCLYAADRMDTKQLVARICGARRFGREPGVVCSRALCEKLGDPQQELRFVHIAGTNGKGSVAAFLREICVQSGMKVGLFTSPHLERFHERIQIGHTQITDEELLRLARRVLRAATELLAEQGLMPTMFDLCLAIALLYFREQQAELVILETGMGGRLDSTNIIPAPCVSVITGIGLEHTQYLGETIEQIAVEKAGILKHGTHAVLMEQPQPALGVLTARCQQLDIPYRVSGRVAEDGAYGGRHYEIGMSGSYQRQNAAAAIEAAGLLMKRGFDRLTPQAICQGILQARWQGRMELICRQPWVLLDGAHNVHGVRALAESLRACAGAEGYTFFMGVMAEKDYDAMLDIMLPLAKRIYTLTPDSARALDGAQLCARIREKGGNAGVCDSVEQLVGLVRALPDTEKCVIFGSLYLIGEVRSHLKGEEKTL